MCIECQRIDLQKDYEAHVHGINRSETPRKMRQKEVKEAAQERGVKWEEIRNLTQNRKEWKKTISSTSQSYTSCRKT